MNRVLRTILSAWLVLWLPGVQAGMAQAKEPTPSQEKNTAAKAPSDAEIKQAIIRESLASYAGSCPCPYNTDRAGRRCGKRSAYSRPGGAAPLCYESDVTQKMVDAYRKRSKKQ